MNNSTITNSINTSPMSEITVSLITNGNGIIKDYVLNNVCGANIQCDFMNKDVDTLLPLYVKTISTIGHIYKENVIDVIMRNNEPVEVFVNRDDNTVATTLLKYQDFASSFDNFKKNYTLATL